MEEDLVERQATEWTSSELDGLSRGEVVRINCGGEAAEPIPGEHWLADRSFVGGNAAREQVADIRGTERDEIYLTQRYQLAEMLPLEYRLPLPSGRYTLRLHFAETWYYVSGQRRFKVAIENNSISIIEPPPAEALVQPIEVDVTDGALNILLLPELADPMICGIEIQKRP
jgi:hypothetical protein